MTRLVDIHGRDYPLGARLGVGAEGAVYEVASDRSLVVKLYHKPLAASDANKLKCMAKIATDELTSFASWPKDVLFKSGSSEVCALLLPRISGANEIHELYNPAERKIRFPNATWAFLVRAAANCAASFAVLHRHGVVIGDVNQKNVMVSQNALARLVDCDSFQVSVGGDVYKCNVGVAHFTPPELHSVCLSTVVRTENHDAFGLAVLIFHLLFVGRHPFAGRYLDRGEMPIEKAIAESRFAYGSRAVHSRMDAPPLTLRDTDLPPQVFDLFERAFRTPKRPSAEEWHRVLVSFEKQLATCKNQPGHVYSRHLNEQCTWCKLRKGGAPEFFISVAAAIQRQSTVSVDWNAIWADIKHVPPPSVLVGRLSSTTVTGLVAQPAPGSDSNQTWLRKVVGSIGAISGVIGLAGIINPLFAVFSLPICIIFCVWWLILITFTGKRGEKRRRRLERERTLLNLQKFRNRCKVRIASYQEKFDSLFSELNAARTEIGNLPSWKQREIEKLTATAKERSLSAYLDQQLICRTNLSGIGPGLISTLASYGVETALDVSRQRVASVPGFGPHRTSIMVAWRQRVESSFVYNPATGLSQKDRDAIDVMLSQKEFHCKAKLKDGPAQLRQISEAATADFNLHRAELMLLERSAAQAQVDYDICGAS